MIKAGVLKSHPPPPPSVIVDLSPISQKDNIASILSNFLSYKFVNFKLYLYLLVKETKLCWKPFAGQNLLFETINLFTILNRLVKLLGTVDICNSDFEGIYVSGFTVLLAFRLGTENKVTINICHQIFLNIWANVNQGFTCLASSAWCMVQCF